MSFGKQSESEEKNVPSRSSRYKFSRDLLYGVLFLLVHYPIFWVLGIPFAEKALLLFSGMVLAFALRAGSEGLLPWMACKQAKIEKQLGHYGQTWTGWIEHHLLGFLARSAQRSAQNLSDQPAKKTKTSAAKTLPVQKKEPKTKAAESKTKTSASKKTNAAPSRKISGSGTKK